jgi:hypothetical protein
MQLRDIEGLHMSAATLCELNTGKIPSMASIQSYSSQTSKVCSYQTLLIEETHTLGGKLEREKTFSEDLSTLFVFFSYLLCFNSIIELSLCVSQKGSALLYIT